jgi:hypothetical protein
MPLLIESSLSLIAACQICAPSSSQMRHIYYYIVKSFPVIAVVGQGPARPTFEPASPCRQDSDCALCFIAVNGYAMSSYLMWPCPLQKMATKELLAKTLMLLAQGLARWLGPLAAALSLPHSPSLGRSSLRSGSFSSARQREET